VTVSVKLFVAVALALSVTRTVNVYVPCFVGFPESTPDVFRVRPGGKEPDALAHV
jgi:hypothetical protein